MVEIDKYGKEIKVNAYGKSVAVYRSDNTKLSFRWIAVFTTKTNCTGSFSWTGTSNNLSITLNGVN